MDGWMDGYDSPWVFARIFTEGWHDEETEEEEVEDDDEKCCARQKCR